jgi:hypothetical protein
MRLSDSHTREVALLVSSPAGGTFKTSSSQGDDTSVHSAEGIDWFTDRRFATTGSTGQPRAGVLVLVSTSSLRKSRYARHESIMACSQKNRSWTAISAITR